MSTPPPIPPTSGWRTWGGILLVPVLAIFTALVIGAIIIVATGADVLAAYGGLFMGAIGSPRAIAYTLVEATPYIFGGLAVLIGFRAGLFNIGVEGQIAVGSMCAVIVGAFVSLPPGLHAVVAFIAGALGGALWGAIPGWLRARTGAHEVITTIMFNYIAIRSTDYLIKVPFLDKESSSQRTPFIAEGAHLPFLFGPDYRLHAGFLIALLAAVATAWFLKRTIIGFEIKTTGANPDAAHYAGMNVPRTIILTMALSGLMAGMAGASQVLGLEHNLKASFSAGYGFDSIAIALLAASNPIGVIPAAMFWGALRNGAGLMQLNSGISITLINIVQALVIAFVAADQIVRQIYRIRSARSAGITLSRGWGR